MSLINNFMKIINPYENNTKYEKEIEKLKKELNLKQLHINKVNAHYKRILSKKSNF